MGKFNKCINNHYLLSPHILFIHDGWKTSVREFFSNGKLSQVFATDVTVEQQTGCLSGHLRDDRYAFSAAGIETQASEGNSEGEIRLLIYLVE